VVYVYPELYSADDVGAVMLMFLVPVTVMALYKFLGAAAPCQVRQLLSYE
jgi:hypothetical protein